MNDPQILNLMLASLPTVLTVLVGILLNNARLGDLRADMNTRFSEIDKRFTDRFNGIDRRFDDMDHRVEQVLDARLKHVEDS